MFGAGAEELQLPGLYLRAFTYTGRVPRGIEGKELVEHEFLYYHREPKETHVFRVPFLQLGCEFGLSFVPASGALFLTENRYIQSRYRGRA